jgi:hypothetical protein
MLIEKRLSLRLVSITLGGRPQDLLIRLWKFSNLDFFGGVQAVWGVSGGGWRCGRVANSEFRDHGSPKLTERNGGRLDWTIGG